MTTTTATIVHLLTEDLEDLCGTASEMFVVTTTPENVTCLLCQQAAGIAPRKPLTAQQRREQNWEW